MYGAGCHGGGTGCGGGFAWPRRSSTKLLKGTSVQVVKSHAGSFLYSAKGRLLAKYVVLF